MESFGEVTIHGDGRVTFCPFYEGGAPHTIDFGPSLVWARKTQGGVILRFRAPFPWLEKRNSGGAQAWAVFTKSPDDHIEVGDDNRSFTINGVHFNVPGILRSANQMPDGSFVVAVVKNEQTGDRNLYRYDKHGALIWQVGDRDFQRGKQFTNAHLRPDGRLKAEGGRDNLGAIVDYETGAVLGQEDIR